jgi:octaprenyl-diphosphate synthase
MFSNDGNKYKELFESINNDLELIEKKLKNNLDSNVLLIPEVGRYILESGGKRLRPLLFLLASRLCGYYGSRIISLASVFEFIHTATLLHDDVVDNAELRRGNASVNSVWGNEISVLVGDFLLSKSFSIMVEDGDVNIMKVIANATTKMAEGEALQLTKNGDINITEEDYISVIINKTAVLISAVCEVSAILANSFPYIEKTMADFGLNLGIAFQLIDDSLDYISQESEFGKKRGNDLQEGKITLPLIHALRNCSPREKERITSIVLSEEIKKENFMEVMELIFKYDGVSYTFNRAREYIDKAKNMLNIFPDSPDKQHLLILADYILERKK